MVVIFSLGVLISVFVLQLVCLKVRFDVKRVIQILLLVSVFLIVAYFAYLVVSQYIIWQNAGPPSVYLVPPYQSILYVINYQFIRFGLYYLLSLGAALLFLSAARWLNRRFDYRFFETEEPYFGALSIFLLGNPEWNYAWIYYIVAILFIASLVTGYQLLITRENRRFSLCWLWFPLAILVILVNSL